MIEIKERGSDSSDASHDDSASEIPAMSILLDNVHSTLSDPSSVEFVMFVARFNGVRNPGLDRPSHDLKVPFPQKGGDKGGEY